MKRLAVAVLVAGLAVLLSMSAAVAAPKPPPKPTGTPAVPGSSVGQDWLRLTLTSQQPRMVTATDTSVTVSGTITNISDRRIRQITTRLQVGDAVTTDAGLRSALAPSANYLHGNTVFTPIAGSLEPGQSVSFTVSADLTGPDSLRLTKPGVYPLLVNVQGVPDFGTTSRLTAASMLLPVIAAPGGAPAPQVGSQKPLTILWPLIDQQPRIVSDNDGLVLSDDSLATSLESGGRLFGLLDAVRQASANDSGLLSALCFAVDPDLLTTVQAMAGGYRVVSGAGTSQGAGAAAAASWLATLKTLTAGRCVLALPYADADLAALSHAGGANMLQFALTAGTTVVRELGGDTSTTVVWPADNALDTTTMTDLAGAGQHTVLLNPDSVTPAATGPAPLAGFTGGNAPTVVPIDQVTSTELAPRTDEPDVNAQGISAQDGLAALVFRTVFDNTDNTGGPVLVAPPRRWAPSATEAQAFLHAASTVLTGHYASATSLSDAVAAVATTSQPVTLNYSPQQSLAEVAPQVVAGAVRSDAAARDVAAAMGRDNTKPTPVLPAELTDPLRLDLLRSVSSAWRDNRTSGAQAALAAASGQFDELRDQVTVVQPGLPILLGSKNSRLPVTVINRLPVNIAIRVDLTGDPGLPATGINDIVPANGSTTELVPATVTRSGRLSIYATVYTPGGTQLGQQARLELSSSAYGTIIVIVTAIAFGLLVLLSGRRIYRRVRAARANVPGPPADRDAAGNASALVGARQADGEHRETGEPDRE